jgi:hypothetical protein
LALLVRSTRPKADWGARRSFFFGICRALDQRHPGGPEPAARARGSLDAASNPGKGQTPDDEDPAVLIDRQATSSGSRLVLGWNRHTVAALVDCASFLLEVHDLAVAT